MYPQHHGFWHHVSIWSTLLALLWLLSQTTASVAQGAIRYVDADASGANNGTAWADAYPKLQDALAAAQPGDEVWVAAGVYYPDEGGGQTDNDRTITFHLKSGVVLYGGFAGAENERTQRNWLANLTILSGDLDQNDVNLDGNFIAETWNDILGANAYHVITGDGAEPSAVLDGFTITAGLADSSVAPHWSGGGMTNAAGSPTLANLVFSGNRALNNGGGMANTSNSRPLLSGLTFRANSAGNGGGMHNATGSNLALTGALFSDNLAEYWGGGIANESASPVLNNVTFSKNQANSYGGGLANIKSSPALTNVTFRDNTSNVWAGGMYNFDGSNPMLNNGLFSGNRARYGGGMYSAFSSNPKLFNTAFIGNSANHDGGGMKTFAGNPVLTNVIFSGNTANIGGGMTNSNSNPVLTNVTFSGNLADSTGGGLVNEGQSNPNLVNVILSNNSALSAPQIFNAEEAQPTISYSLVQGSGGSGSRWDTPLGIDGGHNFDTDPLFMTPIDPITAPTTAGDLRLQPGSPAIDIGLNSANLMPTDLNGNIRIQSAAIDLGAYESSHTAQLAISKQVKTDNGTSRGSIVTYNIELSNNGGAYAYGARLTDTLPDGIKVIDWLGRPPDLFYGELTKTLVWTVTVPTSQTNTLRYAALVTGNLGEVLLNTARYNHAGSTGAAQAQFTIAAVPALLITKTANPTTAIVGETTITYSYRITNTGDVALTVQAVDDRLGPVALMALPEGTVVLPVTLLQVGGVAVGTHTYMPQLSDLPGLLANTMLVTGTTTTGSVVTTTASTSVDLWLRAGPQTMYSGEKIDLLMDTKAAVAETPLNLVVIPGSAPANLLLRGVRERVPYTGYRSMVELTNQLLTVACADEAACQPVTRLVFDQNGSYHIETIRDIQTVAELYLPLVWRRDPIP